MKKLTSDNKSQIENLLIDLETAIQEENYDKMKALNETIKNRMIELGQQVYSQAPTGSTQTNQSADEVIDTDFSTEK